MEILCLELLSYMCSKLYNYDVFSAVRIVLVVSFLLLCEFFFLLTVWKLFESTVHVFQSEVPVQIIDIPT